MRLLDGTQPILGGKEMLKVNQYEFIRTGYRVYGKTIKEIARETGHSKNTVKKVLRGEYKGYSQRDTQPFPVLEPYLGIIDSWLESDKEGNSSYCNGFFTLTAGGSKLGCRKGSILG